MKSPVTTWVELCCGGAAVSLSLLCGSGVAPLVTYMGSKRRQASAVLKAMGLRPGQGAERVLLADVGPWGEVWATLKAEGCAAVADALTSLSARLSGLEPQKRYELLIEEPVPEDPAERAGVYLTLQRMTVMGKPVQHQGGRWKKEGFAYASTESRGKRYSDEQRASLGGIYTRILEMARLDWSRIEVARDARTITPIPGAHVYLDPPYAGTTGYGADLTRAEVLRLGLTWREAGARVAISEREPLHISGWTIHQIGGKADTTGHQARTFTTSADEWLTVSPPGRPPARQFGLDLQFDSTVEEEAS